MHGRRRWVLVLLVVAFTLSACGGSTPDQSASGLPDGADSTDVGGSSDVTGAGETSPDPDGGGAPGAPFDQGDGGGGEGAVPAPMDIPAFTVAGADYREQRAFIHEEIVAACGDGTLCVEVRAEVVDVAGAEPCEILRPLPSGRVPRGSTIVFRVAAPCDPTSAPSSQGGEEIEAGGETDPNGGGSAGPGEGGGEAETGGGSTGTGGGSAGGAGDGGDNGGAADAGAGDP